MIAPGQAALLIALVWMTMGPAGQSIALADDLAGCPQPPRTEGHAPQVPAMIGQRLFNELIAWIAINTSYDLSTVYRDPPTISFCQIGDVIPYERSNLVVDASLLAVFDQDRRHISLRRPWTILSYFDQSVLLHELVHDAQLQAGEGECPGDKEREAYLLQDKWLFERGVNYSFDWAMIARLSACDDDTP